MKLDQLREEHLVKIVRLYERYCGQGRLFNAAMAQTSSVMLAHVKEHVGRWGIHEYQLGSRWGNDSQLIIRADVQDTLSVECRLKYQARRNGVLKRNGSAEQAKKNFVREVSIYLQQQ